jgi:hypothetical protein
MNFIISSAGWSMILARHYGASRCASRLRHAGFCAASGANSLHRSNGEIQRQAYS